MSAGEPRLFAVPQEQLTSDDYYTPAWVFERMGIEFDLDVASPPGGVPWIPAKRYYTQADDGLVQPWEGRVWMNPPYSGVTPWWHKFAAHANGVALLPLVKSAWLNHLWSSRAEVVFPASWFKFTAVNGADGSISYATFFAAFGDECVEAIGHLGVVRRIA